MQNCSWLLQKIKLAWCFTVQGVVQTCPQTGSAILHGLSGADPNSTACSESSSGNAGVYSIWVRVLIKFSQVYRDCWQSCWAFDWLCVHEYMACLIFQIFGGVKYLLVSIKIFCIFCYHLIF